MNFHSILLIFLGLLFLVFAVLQWNDPDPAVWVSVYVAAALFCWMAYRRKSSPWIFGLAFLVYAITGIFVWPEVFLGVTQSMSYSPFIEEARESLGLFICAAAMAYCFFLSYRNRRKTYT